MGCGEREEGSSEGEKEEEDRKERAHIDCEHCSVENGRWGKRTDAGATKVENAQVMLLIGVFKGNAVC